MACCIAAASLAAFGGIRGTKGGALQQLLQRCQFDVVLLNSKHTESADTSSFTNFVARRHISDAIVQRAVREVPWESRTTLLRERVVPTQASECRGTPRREYNENLFEGIRVKPTFNPYVKYNKAKRYVMDNWPSRNWDDWTPYRCYVRGSRRRYNIPQDLFPYKDELGEWHPPRLSARYKADVKKQYQLNGLPWVWEKDFYEGKLHFADRELLGPKRWYRQAFRRERVVEALRKMDDLVFEYRQETRDRKRYDWFEKVVHDFAGEDIATQFIRKRKDPKL